MDYIWSNLLHYFYTEKPELHGFIIALSFLECMRLLETVQIPDWKVGVSSQVFLVVCVCVCVYRCN